MGTGYGNEKKFILSGRIDEDYEEGTDKNTDLIRAELNLIAVKYGLDLTEEDLKNG